MNLYGICLSPLISISIMPSRSTYVITSGQISFFFMAEPYAVAQTYHVFICSSVDGRLGCFHTLATLTKHSKILIGKIQVGLFGCPQKSSFNFATCLKFFITKCWKKQIITWPKVAESENATSRVREGFCEL